MVVFFISIECLIGRIKASAGCIDAECVGQIEFFRTRSEYGFPHDAVFALKYWKLMAAYGNYAFAL